jgi:hypothetical protein
MRSLIMSKHELLDGDRWLNDNIVRQWNMRGRGLEEGLGKPVISRIAARNPVPRWKTQARSIRTRYPLLPSLARQLLPGVEADALAAAYTDVASPFPGTPSANQPSPPFLSPVLRSSVGFSAASAAIKSIAASRPGSFLGPGSSLASPGSTLPWAWGMSVTPTLQSSGPTGHSFAGAGMSSLPAGGDTGSTQVPVPELGPGGLTLPSAPSASPASLTSVTTSPSPGLTPSGPTNASTAASTAASGPAVQGTTRRPSSLGPGAGLPPALMPAVAGGPSVPPSPLGHSPSLVRTGSPSQDDLISQGSGSGATPRAGDSSSLLADGYWNRLAAGARATASPASAANASLQVRHGGAGEGREVL